MWEEAYANGTEDRLIALNNGAIQGLLGVCVDQTEIKGSKWSTGLVQLIMVKYQKVCPPSPSLLPNGVYLK